MIVSSRRGAVPGGLDPAGDGAAQAPPHAGPAQHPGYAAPPVTMVVSTDDAPTPDRFGHYRDALAHEPVPLELRAQRPEDFSGRTAIVLLGAVTVCTVAQWSGQEYTVRRTPALIRRLDPEVCRLLVNLSGHSVLSQGGNQAVLSPGDMALADTSLPFGVWRGGGAHRFATLTFPRDLLPIGYQRTRALHGRRIQGRRGVGGLISNFVSRLSVDADQYPAVDACRLSMTVLDVLTVLVRHELELPCGALPRQSQRRSLLMGAQAYIQRHLHDPGLTPAEVARAQFVSLRTMHKVFQEHGLSIGGWIRTVRLERCRRSLADPALSAVPIQVIAARCGLACAAQFSRAFRAAYGQSPSEYRHRHAAAAALPAAEPGHARR